MKKIKQETQSVEAEKLRANARAALAKRTLKSSRFLNAALSNGSDFEPVGRLAG